MPTPSRLGAIETQAQYKQYPPQFDGGLPLLGHMPSFWRAPIDLLQRGYQRCGEVFSLRVLTSWITVLIGPEANEAFFRAPDDQLSQKEAYGFTVPIFGKGIAYDAPSEIMREQLGFLYPALHEDRLRRYARLMVEEAESYVESWGDTGEIDLLTVTNELTTFIASHCLLGAEFRYHLSTEFAQLYHAMERGLTLLAFFFPNLPLPMFRRRDQARMRMVELISAIVEARRAKGVQDEDFLQTLMEAHYADGRALTDDEITGLLLTILFAGQHTSAVLAAWTGILLLHHPHYLPPILDEQHEILGHGQEVTLERLNEMTCLDRAVTEAERMHPPLVMLMRKVLRDFEYGGYVVPADHILMVSPAVSHRLPEVFADPDRYDPDRYGPGRDEGRRHPYHLIGFGGGRHRCIGFNFAYMQVKALWSVLLRHFEFELASPTYVPNYSSVVVGPQQPCRVRYRRLMAPS